MPAPLDVPALLPETCYSSPLAELLTYPPGCKYRRLFGLRCCFQSAICNRGWRVVDVNSASRRYSGVVTGECAIGYGRLTAVVIEIAPPVLEWLVEKVTVCHCERV